MKTLKTPLATALTILTLTGCSDDRPVVLIAARATVVQQSSTRNYRCGRGGYSICTEPLAPSVHFMYDGKPIYHEVKSDFDLRGFRHWGCYWLRVAVSDSERLELKTVISEAPTQACP